MTKNVQRLSCKFPVFVARELIPTTAMKAMMLLGQARAMAGVRDWAGKMVGAIEELLSLEAGSIDRSTASVQFCARDRHLSSTLDSSIRGMHVRALIVAPLDEGVVKLAGGKEILDCVLRPGDVLLSDFHAGRFWGIGFKEPEGRALSVLLVSRKAHPEEAPRSKALMLET